MVACLFCLARGETWPSCRESTPPCAGCDDDPEAPESAAGSSTKDLETKEGVLAAGMAADDDAAADGSALEDAVGAEVDVDAAAADVYDGGRG